MLQSVLIKETKTKQQAGFVDSYRNLTVWKRAMDFAEHTYNITSIFPSESVCSLARQIRDSAVDIPTQIAKGYSQPVSENRTYYIDEAKKSLAQIETQLLLASRVGYIGHMQSQNTFDEIFELRDLLDELQRSLPVSE